jgi:hypothetical protein
MKNATSSTPSATGCYARVRVAAEKIVENWETSFDADKTLCGADEPDSVSVAKEFLRLLAAVDQCVASGFASAVANGVLRLANESYA